MSKPLSVALAALTLTTLTALTALTANVRAEPSSIASPSGLTVGVFAKESALRFDDVKGRTVGIGDSIVGTADGATTGLGAGLSFLGWTSRLRYGLDLSCAFGVRPGEGVSLDAPLATTDPHPRGRSVFVATLQPFAGTWLAPGRVRPYFDASLRYEIASFGEGGAGAAAFTAGRVSVLPRLGLASQLFRYLGTDVSIGGTFFGFTRVEVRAGILF